MLAGGTTGRHFVRVRLANRQDVDLTVMAAANV